MQPQCYNGNDRPVWMLGHYPKLQEDCPSFNNTCPGSASSVLPLMWNFPPFAAATAHGASSNGAGDGQPQGTNWNQHSEHWWLEMSCPPTQHFLPFSATTGHSTGSDWFLCAAMAPNSGKGCSSADFTSIFYCHPQSANLNRVPMDHLSNMQCTGTWSKVAVCAVVA